MSIRCCLPREMSEAATGYFETQSDDARGYSDVPHSLSSVVTLWLETGPIEEKRGGRLRWHSEDVTVSCPEGRPDNCAGFSHYVSALSRMNAQNECAE
jgi:hypothetical protein